MSEEYMTQFSSFTDIILVSYLKFSYWNIKKFCFDFAEKKKKTKQVINILKVELSPSKKVSFICFKIDEKCFSFYVKSSFRPQDI